MVHLAYFIGLMYNVQCTIYNVHCRQVDVYSQLVAHTAEEDRLKISRRVLRKLLRIRDIARLSFR